MFMLEDEEESGSDGESDLDAVDPNEEVEDLEDERHPIYTSRDIECAKQGNPYLFMNKLRDAKKYGKGKDPDDQSNTVYKSAILNAIENTKRYPGVRTAYQAVEAAVISTMIAAYTNFKYEDHMYDYIGDNDEVLNAYIEHFNSDYKGQWKIKKVSVALVDMVFEQVK